MPQDGSRVRGQGAKAPQEDVIRPEQLAAPMELLRKGSAWAQWVEGSRSAQEFEDHLVANRRPLTEEDVRVMQALECRAHNFPREYWGAYRTRPATIREQTSDEAVGDITKVIPAMSEAELSAGVWETLAILNDNTQGLDIVGRVGEAHWKFIMEVHPFNEYNGRSMRRLMNVFLRREGRPSFTPQSDENDWFGYMESQSARDPAIYGRRKPTDPIPPREASDPYRKRMFMEFMHRYFDSTRT
jgi:hypothetical protein